MDVRALRRRLLAWYGRHQRTLPWRKPAHGTPQGDPVHDADRTYLVWVSETMLQQTRIDVAIPYYTRWLERFPTVQALARASEDEVLQAWAGLGYYARARNLHAAAKTVAAHGWPTTLVGWRALPGVGPYTAAAVASIAQGTAAACVDGNVVRVVTRLADLAGDVGTKAVRDDIAALAQAWLAPTRPGDWNQAMMDLGATVCTPREPRCEACPVSDLCVARAAGTQSRRPNKRRPTPPKEEHRAVAVIEDAGRILFVRGETGLLRGMWGLPNAPLTDPAEPLDGVVLRQAGVQVRLDEAVAAAVHQFSHRTWRMRVQRGRVVTTPPARSTALAGKRHHRWIPRDRLHAEAIPAAAHAALCAVGVTEAKPKTKAGSAKA